MMDARTIDELTEYDIMQMDSAQFDALAWAEDQCAGCPLAGQCDPINRELCSGALRYER